MSKPLPPVEYGNSLELPAYVTRYLPELAEEVKFESTKLPAPCLISIEHALSIKSTDLESCFNLLAEHTQKDYAVASMGWHPRRKREEMKLPDLRYLLVRHSPETTPEGFASFMLTYEDCKEVVYLYEIHLKQSLRGTGLGKKLIGMVEDSGRKAGMEKAMLTVFRSNTPARQFYTALGYDVDEYSPEPKILRGGKVKECDYEILSKVLS